MTASSGPEAQLVVDMDDFCLNDGPEANGLHWLFYLKGKFPDFKCTLFTIPGRSTLEWLWEVNKLDWIQLAMHGWNHDEKETITEQQLRSWPFAKIYKGPNWKLSAIEMRRLIDLDFIVATKEEETSVILKDYPKIWCLTDPRAAHGHIWVEADFSKLMKRIEPNTKFQFISEVAYD